jgi:hypothetical protein
MLTSSEEKFKSAVEISNHLNMVKRKLVVQFWKNVEVELKYLVEINNEEFKVILDSDIFYSNSGCSLFLENNSKAGFIYEHLSGDQCMGLWFKNPEFDMRKIDNYRIEQQYKITNYSTYSWWISYQNINENFNNSDSLLMILPDKSMEYAKIKAQNLFELAVGNKEHLKYIINNCLK